MVKCIVLSKNIRNNQSSVVRGHVLLTSGTKIKIKRKENHCHKQCLETKLETHSGSCKGGSAV